MKVTETFQPFLRESQSNDMRAPQPEPQIMCDCGHAEKWWRMSMVSGIRLCGGCKKEPLLPPMEEPKKIKNEIPATVPSALSRKTKGQKKYSDAP